MTSARWPWPDDKRLAVSIVVNFEEGAELSIAAGDERNEHIYEVVERVDGYPDPCMTSHFAYGLNEGWPRVRALLKRYGARATLNACGRAVAQSPWLAREAAEDGHEVSAHGWRWERHVGMDEATERRGDRPDRPGDHGGHRSASRRLAHPVGRLGQHAPAAPRARRIYI